MITAEEIAHKYVYGKHDALTDRQEVKDMVKDIIEFTKLHVKAALEAVGSKALEIQKPDTRRYVGKKVLIDSYPLENIK